MKKWIVGLLFGLFLCIPQNVDATSLGVTLTCPASVAAGETFECNVNAQVGEGNLTSFKVQFQNNEGLTYQSFTAGTGWTTSTASATGFTITNPSGKTGTLHLGTIAMKIPAGAQSNAIYNLGLVGVEGTDENGNVLMTTESHKSIRVKSNINFLSSLNVSNATMKPTFQENVFEYTATVDGSISSVQINAVVKDINARFVIGPRRVNLNYGENTERIVVRSETGDQQTYLITIHRPDNRSTDNTLKALIVSAGNLNPGFQPNTTSYEVKVGSNVDKIDINATLNDSKALFLNGYGPRSVNLNYGTNEIELKTKAENGQEKTYKIKVTRSKAPNQNQSEAKSQNNNLKSITLDRGRLDFKSDVLEYEVSLPFTAEKFIISAEAEDNKAKIEGLGEQNLQVGENLFEIKVTAEDGSEKVYKIKAIRAEEQDQQLDKNNNLSYLEIQGYTIDFNKNKTIYEIQYNGQKELKIDASAESSFAEVTILGNENLKVGSKIKVIVTAEDGMNKEYTIVLKEKKSGSLIVPILVFGLGIIAVVGSVYYSKKRKETSELY